MRTMLKEEYFDRKYNHKVKGVYITKPVDLDFENHCLQKYIQIIKLVL